MRRFIADARRIRELSLLRTSDLPAGIASRRRVGTRHHATHTIPVDKSPSHAQDRNVSTKRTDRSPGSASVDLSAAKRIYRIERPRLLGEDRRQHACNNVLNLADGRRDTRQNHLQRTRDIDIHDRQAGRCPSENRPLALLVSTLCVCSELHRGDAEQASQYLVK